MYCVPAAAAAAAVGSLRETMMAKEDVHNNINDSQTDRPTNQASTHVQIVVCLCRCAVAECVDELTDRAATEK